ncbi:7414_t:CDS:2 [Entrophospora sp. SA101]|nr:7414_t:CDS:2 [Entrophospora sp. SA101]
MKYYENGNLYQFLDESKGVLCWRDIVEILWSISNELAQKIIDGKRPKISKEAPKSYNDLMQQCWDHDPSKRPTASKLYETIGSWFTKICNDPTPTEISIEFDKAEGIKFSKLEKYAFQRQKIHNEAIYTSRLLNFPGLRRQQS